MDAQICFETYLRKENLSENTIFSYVWTVNSYFSHYDEISRENLLAFKGQLMENYKPKTVNLRVQAMNKYLIFLDEERLQLKNVKIQQKNLLENVISNADYKYFKKRLKQDENMALIPGWYTLIPSATGMLKIFLRNTMTSHYWRI